MWFGWKIGICICFLFVSTKDAGHLNDDETTEEKMGAEKEAYGTVQQLMVDDLLQQDGQEGDKDESDGVES